MDDVTQLTLAANGDTTLLRRGQVVHVNGMPYELLAEVEAYSATKSSPFNTRSSSGSQESE